MSKILIISFHDNLNNVVSPCSMVGQPMAPSYILVVPEMPREILSHFQWTHMGMRNHGKMELQWNSIELHTSILFLFFGEDLWKMELLAKIVAPGCQHLLLPSKLLPITTS